MCEHIEQHMPPHAVVDAKELKAMMILADKHIYERRSWRKEGPEGLPRVHSQSVTRALGAPDIKRGRQRKGKVFSKGCNGAPVPPPPIPA